MTTADPNESEQAESPGVAQEGPATAPRALPTAQAGAGQVTAPFRVSATTPQSINTIQNERATVDLLAAAHTAHSDSQWWESLRGGAVVLISLIATVAAFLPGLSPTASIAGGIVAVLQLGVNVISAKHTTIATRVQEQFDLRVFGLPHAAHTGRGPGREQIESLARRFWALPHEKRPNKHDWYVDVTGLPRPYAILLCQRENLQWDWPLRRRWALILVSSALGWLLLGIAVALISDWSTRELLLRWWIPSLPAWSLALGVAYRNYSVASHKQQLAIAIDESLAALPAVNADNPADAIALNETFTECRTHQDGIYAMRNYPERIPQWLYHLHRTDDEQDARIAASDIRNRLLDDRSTGEA